MSDYGNVETLIKSERKVVVFRLIVSTVIVAALSVWLYFYVSEKYFPLAIGFVWATWLYVTKSLLRVLVTGIAFILTDKGLIAYVGDIDFVAWDEIESAYTGSVGGAKVVQLDIRNIDTVLARLTMFRRHILRWYMANSGGKPNLYASFAKGGAVGLLQLIQPRISLRATERAGSATSRLNPAGTNRAPAPILVTRRQFFVRERVSFLALADTYDIFDPQTNLQIGVARDEPSGWTKLLRFLGGTKDRLSTTVRIYEREGSPAVLSLRKWGASVENKLTLTDAQGAHLGSFVSKFKLVGGGILVLDEHGNQFAEVEGDWKLWNFRFLDAQGRELGIVTKKWEGIGKELFTNANDYLISVSDIATNVANASALLLAAGLAIDMFFKEW